MAVSGGPGLVLRWSHSMAGHGTGVHASWCGTVSCGTRSCRHGARATADPNGLRTRCDVADTHDSAPRRREIYIGRCIVLMSHGSSNAWEQPQIRRSLQSQEIKLGGNPPLHPPLTSTGGYQQRCILQPELRRQNGRISAQHAGSESSECAISGKGCVHSVVESSGTHHRLAPLP